MVERIVPNDRSWNQQIAPHIQRYRFALPYVCGKRVLDAGCGVGYGSRLLASSGAAQVVAVDISREALEVAEKQFAHDRLQFICDDCQSLTKVGGAFDAVISFEALEHFPDGHSFVARIAELLAPQGVFIVSTPNKSLSNGSNPYHVREYSLAEFRELLEPHFNRVTLLGQHWTAAYLAFHRAAGAMWNNPFMRLGRWLQKIRGHEAKWPLAELVPTESDVVISELYPEAAMVLIAICRNVG